MRGDRIAIIEVAHPAWIKRDAAPGIAVHAHRHGAGLDGGHRAEIAAGYAQLFIPCRELKAVPSRELARCFLVSVHALQSPWIIGHGPAVFEADGDVVLPRVNRKHGGNATPLDALHLAAGRVLKDISGLVSCSPASIRSGHVGAVYERP